MTTLTCTFDLFKEDICLSVIDSTVWGQIIELAIFLCAFSGLAIAAEHLCNSMETLCDHWRIHEDVGGATFIALGGAIPEITINCVSTLKAISGGSASDAGMADMGVGAILGSGLIAFLLIPACSALLSGSPLLVRKRALYRDATFYILAVLVLMSAVYFGIHQYHAPILVSLYICYVLLLVFADHLSFFWSHAIGHPHLGPVHHVSHQSVFRERYSPKAPGGSELDASTVPLLPINGASELFDSADQWTSSEAVSSGWTSDCLAVGSYAIAPIKLAIDSTCPDCRIFKPRENWYLITFLTAFLWITLFSFVITVVVERWVALLNVPGTSALLGLVLVAAGAEIPDSVNAVTIAKRGFGGMAIGACLGSQVVNICLGLGMPWLIASLMGKAVPLSSTNWFIHEASVLLLLAVVVVVFVVAVLGPAHALGRAEITRPKAWSLMAGYMCVIGVLAYATVLHRSSP